MVVIMVVLVIVGTMTAMVVVMVDWWLVFLMMMMLTVDLTISSFQPPSGATEARKPEETKESEQKPSPKDKDQDETLDSSVIDNFAANMLPGCVSLVSDVPETVYKACDLIVAISARNGHEWRDRVLGDILNTVSHAQRLLGSFTSLVLRKQPMIKTIILI